MFPLTQWQTGVYKLHFAITDVGSKCDTQECQECNIEIYTNF